MEQKSSKRMCSMDSNFEHAEFISARTDTKQRLGELFIQHPTKLEMFGLRQVSSRIPKFKHKKPLFELPMSDTQRSLTHQTTSIIDCSKCSQSLSKMINNKTHHEQLVLSQPTLVAEERKELQLQPPKRLASHHGRLRNELPPILAHPNISPPPSFQQSLKTQTKQKTLGKLSFGRISKNLDHDLMQVIQSELQKQFNNNLQKDYPIAKMLQKYVFMVVYAIQAKLKKVQVDLSQSGHQGFQEVGAVGGQVKYF
ncbi:unnamed protein product (macronuclear) [Paramecium tetraurelia]|uniref:C2H2-type domain-containing protein n=1 Tax=Paramecium tetraurelia TaxID=5888 RepID=A0C8D7_PARTE|nr:uncharacterized protein GSPATT00036187001 [Paramecium tetraurelia]CAK67054.1 unnamed protein product [Paramecium tetraurelia]|eukprot:XP_001434451.1 hypothetical protein (macronuclear) [Paramecium tetraurelia strain d4-2]